MPQPPDGRSARSDPQAAGRGIRAGFVKRDARERPGATREALVATMLGEMPDAHRQFLIGFKRGERTGNFWRCRSKATSGLVEAADLEKMLSEKRKS